MKENKERVKYWIELADYDLETAKAMLQGERYLYVGFMCHQTVEKALKAVMAQKFLHEDIPPKTHNLIKLAALAEVHEVLSQSQRDFVARLNPLNIEARYPSYKQQLLDALTKDECEKIISETEVLLCWIKSRLGK